MINYKIASKSIRDWGLVVEEGVGLLDPLTPKRNPYKQLEQHTHGEVMNRQKVYFEARKIQLKCTLIADDPIQFSERVSALKRLLYEQYSSDGTYRLEVETPAKYPLEYEVYCANVSQLGKVRWRSGKMAASVTLNFVEPEPVKRVYRVTDPKKSVVLSNPQSIQLNVYCSTRFHFASGEGFLAPQPRVLFDVKDKRTSINYPFATEDYIITTGDLNSSDGISLTNTTLVWR